MTGTEQSPAWLVAGSTVAGSTVAGATPSSSPSPTGTSTRTPSQPGPDPDLVTPGALGFVVVFLLAIATWLLLRNMSGRLRRMRLREEQAERDRPDDVLPPDGTAGDDRPR